ncbi:MAG TPA: hypothetical protein VIM07_17510 [Chitinophagaceae bacterium]
MKEPLAVYKKKKKVSKNVSKGMKNYKKSYGGKYKLLKKSASQVLRIGGLVSGLNTITVTKIS